MFAPAARAVGAFLYFWGCRQLQMIADNCTLLQIVADNCTQLQTVAGFFWDITRVSIRSAARAVCGSDVRGSTDEWPGFPFSSSGTPAFLLRLIQ